MRGVATIFFILLFSTSLWISGCSTGGGGSGVAERVIAAQPAEIMTAVGRTFESEGMERISRSDGGDIYQIQLSQEQLRGHSTLSSIAERGAMTLRARVSRSQIELTSSFPDSDTVLGFTVALSPAPDGQGTLARLEPLVQGLDTEEERRQAEAMRRGFARQGETFLAGIARASEY
jgi:hypothetical protein